MLKLSRNCIASKKILFDSKGDPIKWEYIENLDRIQRCKMINFGNKLTKTHIEWEDRKMCVRIAAQTLSNSVADSIEFLNTVKKEQDFADSDSTTEYIRTINNLFDIMNTKRNHGGTGFKRPISDSTIDEFQEYFQSGKSYLQGLQLENARGYRVPILKTRSFTPFFGFYYNMISFVGIYNDYIKGSGMNELHTFDMSQDHLETFFGCIRRMNGCNDNPTAQQFEAAYRKLLVHNEVTCSEYSNCQNDVTKILQVSSRKRGKETTIENEIDITNLLFSSQDSNNSDEISQIGLEVHSRVYLASTIEKRVTEIISRRGKKKCSLCMEVFVQNTLEVDSLVELKSKSNYNSQPCKSTVNILFEVDQFLKKLDNENISFDQTCKYFLNHMNFSRFYESSNFDASHDHRNDLIELIIKTYLNFRSVHIAKIITRQSQGKLIRHKLLKDLHSLGQ